jgi:hypothetical protein
MRNLFVAWQSPGPSRAWYPVGRLEADPEREIFRFRYLQGAERAVEAEGFSALLSFPDRFKVYEAAELFPLFQNRLLSQSRPEYQSLLEVLSMRPEEADPIELLALAGGQRRTDNLEVFPEVVANGSGYLSARFFLHGWRHLPEHARHRVDLLQKGEQLQVALECNNPATAFAVQVQSADYSILGWAPRYLMPGLGECLLKSGMDLRCQVAGINSSSGMNQWKLLVELAGFVEPGRTLMQGRDFEPLAPAAAQPVRREELALAV